ncbi:hypothetical protein ElyMa_002058900 [Elysia marginata]|uniref:Uncharacterized protein n=1 Tax=Elysia marginata TaxID=1093978 RepID=A0AAV4FAX2_9GAST|nr:hypothetical protein ElyMa_002058900 [Elysia marginata]
MMSRAAVTKEGFLCGRVRSKLNRCTEWLERQPLHFEERLIAQAKEERLKRSVVYINKEVDCEISIRRQELAKERTDKTKSSVMRSVKKGLASGSFIELQSEP